MSHTFTLHKTGFVHSNKWNLERKLFFLHSDSSSCCKNICNIYVYLLTENVMTKMLKRRRWVLEPVVVIVGRGVLIPLLFKDPLYGLPQPIPPPFSNFVQHPSFSCCLQTPTLLILLSCFFGWMGITPTLMIDIMDLHMSSLRSLMCVVKFNVVWYIMWFFADTLIWYHTHNTLRGQYTYPYKKIFAPAVSSYLYFIEWIIQWYQKFTFHNFYFVQELFTCKSHICWLDAITIRSSCETQIILIQMVQINKTHTYTHQTLRERWHWKGLVSIKASDNRPF